MYKVLSRHNNYSKCKDITYEQLPEQVCEAAKRIREQFIERKRAVNSNFVLSKIADKIGVWATLGDLALQYNIVPEELVDLYFDQVIKSSSRKTKILFQSIQPKSLLNPSMEEMLQAHLPNDIEGYYKQCIQAYKWELESAFTNKQRYSKSEIHKEDVSRDLLRLPLPNIAEPWLRLLFFPEDPQIRNMWLDKAVDQLNTIPYLKDYLKSLNYPIEFIYGIK